MDHEQINQYLHAVSLDGAPEPTSKFEGDMSAVTYDGQDFIAVVNAGYDGYLVLYEIPIKKKFVFRGIPVLIER